MSGNIEAVQDVQLTPFEIGYLDCERVYLSNEIAMNSTCVNPSKEEDSRNVPRRCMPGLEEVHDMGRKYSFDWKIVYAHNETR